MTELAQDGMGKTQQGLFGYLLDIDIGTTKAL